MCYYIASDQLSRSRIECYERGRKSTQWEGIRLWCCRGSGSRHNRINCCSRIWLGTTIDFSINQANDHGSVDESGSAGNGGSVPAATTTTSTTRPSPTSTTQPPMYLTDVEPNPIQMDPNSDTGEANVKSISANGVEYGHAIDMTAGCQNEDGGDMWADYDLARSWSHLTGTVALSDNSPTGSMVTFTISVDGQGAQSGTLVIGNSFLVNLSIAGALRLRLAIDNPAAPQLLCLGNPEAQIVFGDLELSH